MFQSLFGGLVRTMPQLQTALQDVTVFGIVVGVVVLALSVLWCFAIPWASDRMCYKKRRWIFILMGILNPLMFWTIIRLTINIQNQGFLNMFVTRLSIVTGCMLVGYFLLGLLMAKFIMRRSKFGSILGPEKD